MRCTILVGALALACASLPAHAVERGPGDGSGPHLGTIIDRASETEDAPQAAPSIRQETWTDLPADVFLPGKADPTDWMATATLAYFTTDGIRYSYGYDPLAQSYDLIVSGLAVDPGILVQETIGVLATELPPTFTPGQIERVELWFYVEQHNLFPTEGVGITALEGDVAPRSSLDIIDMQRLYDDARGFSGAAYVIEHFGAGPHAIDLGTTAVDHLSNRIDQEGWFGVGLAADGWDLSQSMGTTVFWQVSGGGSLPASNRPFFRVVYNAPPDPFALLAPADGATVGRSDPEFSWQAASDPNLDGPLQYTIRLGSDPSLVQALEFDVGTATRSRPPLPLAPGEVFWEVVARDPRGAERTSARRSFTVVTATDTPALGPGTTLSVAPNPFNPRTTVEWSSAIGGAVNLVVLDLRGRRVRTLVDGHVEAGLHRTVWDGRDDGGRAVASGSYRLFLRTPQETRVRALSLVR